MLERELQDYLFDHPDVLVPDEAILEKSREFWIQSKRIDLLFRTERTRYIIELKAVPLTREHIGQVVEYYGLMREQIRDEQFKMVLVAPSIAAFQKPFLEELGIRCIEIPSIPGGRDVTLSCGKVGVLLTVWLMKVVRSVAPDGFGDRWSPLRLDPLVLGFTVSISILSGILSGSWPVWHISGVEPNSVLKSDGNAWGRTRSRNRWMFGLVAGETILAFLLMTGAGLLSKSLVRSLHLDTSRQETRDQRDQKQGQWNA